MPPLTNHLLHLPPTLRYQAISTLHNPPNTHVPLNGPSRAFLAIASATGALLNPHRHDLIATLAETTSHPYFLPRLRRCMLSHPTGRRILRDRPRISSITLPLEQLQKCGEGTVGRAYADWLSREGVSPDTREPVRYIPDEEEAYVMQRYRETHDFTHAITGLPIFLEGELAVKAFEFANTLLPMTGLSLFAAAKLKGPRTRKRFWGTYFPWAVVNGLKAEEVVNVYWEEELGTPLEVLRGRLGIEAPPDLRELRREGRARGREGG